MSSYHSRYPFSSSASDNNHCLLPILGTSPPSTITTTTTTTTSPTTATTTATTMNTTIENSVEELISRFEEFFTMNLSHIHISDEGLILLKSSVERILKEMIEEDIKSREEKLLKHLSELTEKLTISSSSSSSSSYYSSVESPPSPPTTTTTNTTTSSTTTIPSPSQSHQVFIALKPNHKHCKNSPIQHSLNELPFNEALSFACCSSSKELNQRSSGSTDTSNHTHTTRPHRYDHQQYSNSNSNSTSSNRSSLKPFLVSERFRVSKMQNDDIYHHQQ
jgi:hypothetical protein